MSLLRNLQMDGVGYAADLVRDARMFDWLVDRRQFSGEPTSSGFNLSCGGHATSVISAKGSLYMGLEMGMILANGDAYCYGFADGGNSLDLWLDYDRAE
jgi:hypothetical protein